MYKPINGTTKATILEEIKTGTKVAAVAEKYAVKDKTIYRWLKEQADNTGTSALEVARLKKENAELKEIIGMFALEKKRGGKNHKGA